MIRRLLKGLALLLVLGLALLGYARYGEPNWVQVETYRVGSPKVAAPVTLACFADTHVGLGMTVEGLSRRVEQINRQKADVVVFLGDLFDDYSRYEGDPHRVAAALGAIDAPYKIAVMGNHDVGGEAEWVYESLMEEAGFTVLRNQSLQVGDVNFMGADEMLFFTPDVEGLAREGAYNVVLCHEPDFADQAGAFDLMLAGHTHGGQVRLPFFAPFVRPPGGQAYTAGFYGVGDGRLYVNRGLGTTALPLRFFARPEVTVLRLEPGESGTK